MPSKQNKLEKSPAKSTVPATRRLVIVVLISASVAAVAVVARSFKRRTPHTTVANSTSSTPTAPVAALTINSHDELLAMSPAELEKVDIARMNLLCAMGLPGSEGLNISACLKRLDEWAAKVKAVTDRHLYRATDPRYAAHYGNSVARLRAEMLVQVLQEDCGVHYNMQRIRNVDFGNPKDVFIYGMIDDANGGTCTSMPVLYVAVGRRLGYPMKLALAKQHVYCKWEDAAETFNIDGSANGGLDFPPDDEYRTWPEPISDAEMATGEFLRSLTPTEELSLFISIRGYVYHARWMMPEALACYKESHRLRPNDSGSAAAIRQASRGLPMPGQQVQYPRPKNASNPPGLRGTLPSRRGSGPHPSHRTPRRSDAENSRHARLEARDTGKSDAAQTVTGVFA